jgi:hypothetical protein
MNRTLCSISRAPLALLAACVALVVLLAPSRAAAGLPYRVEWALTQENPACESANLSVFDGDAFFHVNGTPLPTRQLAGALVDNPDGSQSNLAEASFDSTLLRTGDNGFSFAVDNSNGDSSCVHARNVVTLISDPIGLKKTLFNVRRDGTGFAGNTALSLSLAEINPPLAKDIVSLEVALAAERESLIANASKLANLAAKQSLLQKLDTELHDLVNRPLDEIAKTDLDAILDRYADVIDPATKAALEQLLADLAQSETDLQAQLASLIDAFGAQSDAVVDLVTQDAKAAGFSPDDPSSYALGAAELPWVDVPDISNVAGAFSPGNDPYAAYAKTVIQSLTDDVENGQVTERADFVATVRAWQANDKALGSAVKARAMVSQAETNAFTNAHNSVVQYIQIFMDASGWLKDASAPPVLRAYVDGVLKQGFDNLSDEMKDNLNIVKQSLIDCSKDELCQTITAFSGVVSNVDDPSKYTDMMQTLAAATSRIAIGFVPVVGQVLDLCECVTGKAWCLPSGKELSTEERVFAGAGVVIGSVAHVWAGVKLAGITPAAALVAEDIVHVDEAIAQGLHANPRTWYKTLRAAADTKPLNAFEVVAGKYMQENGRALIGIGDNGVRDVLAMQGGEKAADFLTVTKGGKLAISEAKGAEATVDAKHAVDQISSTMAALEKKGLAGDVERVELMMKKGVPFKDPKFGLKDGYLINKLTGQTVEVPGFKMVFVKVVQL